MEINTACDSFIERVHSGEARRENKGASLCRVQNVDDFCGGSIRKLRRARVGHTLWKIEHSLSFIIEVRRSDQIVRLFIKSQALADEIKVARACQRRRGHHYCL